MPDAVPARNVRRGDVLIRFCLSPSGLHKNLKLGRFPQPFFVGGKPLWREVDLVAVENGTWSPRPAKLPEPADEDPFGPADELSAEGKPAPPAPPSLRAKMGRPPGSKNRPKVLSASPLAHRPTSTLPAHLGGPSLLDQIRGAR